MHTRLHRGLREPQQLRCTLTLKVQEATKCSDFVEGVLVGFDDRLRASIDIVLCLLNDSLRFMMRVWMVYEGILVACERTFVMLYRCIRCVHPLWVSVGNLCEKTINSLELNFYYGLYPIIVYPCWVFHAGNCEDLSRFAGTVCLLQRQLGQRPVNTPSGVVGEFCALTFEPVACWSCGRDHRHRQEIRLGWST